MADVKLNVDANVNTSDLDAQIAAISSKFNAMAAAIAKANNLKFSPVTNATLSDVQKLTRNYTEMLKLQASLRERMKATSQGGSTFENLDFNRMYTDPAQAHRARVNAFRRVTSGTPFDFNSYDPIPQQRPAPGGNGGGGSNGGGGGGRPPEPRQERWGPGSYPSRIIGAGLRGAGPAGGVAAGALDTGLGVGIGAGVGGLLGGLAALGIGKLVSGVSAKVGDAQQEAIGIDTLKRSLGDVGVDFVTLREKVRAVSDSMGLTFTETRKVAGEFSKLTGNANPAGLSGAISFGRGFGIDPSSSAQFAGRMRQSGGVSNDAESKRLGLNIAEAIGRAGVFTKTDQVLEAVANFSEQAASSSLTRGNTDGYLGAMTGLAGSGLPGMTPNAVASLLGRANSAIQNGGAAGEAGQNFMYRAINGDRKLSPFETKLMQEGGMFATRSSVLGKGTLFNQYTDKSFQGSDTVFDQMRAQLGANYKDPGLRAMAMSSLTGLNSGQSMALDKFATTNGEGGVGKMAAYLRSKGIKLENVNEGGMGALAALQRGGKGELASQAQSLLGRTGTDALSKEESTRLQKAIEVGDKEELRKVLIELTATRSQESTDGDKTRKSIVDLSNVMQRAATPLIGPINTMRDAMVLLASGEKKLGSAGIAAAVRKIERDETARSFDAESGVVMATHNALVGGARAKSAAARSRAAMAERGDGKYGAMSAEDRAAVIKAANKEVKEADAVDIGAADTKRDKDLASIGARRASALGKFDNNSGDLFSGISGAQRAIIEAVAAEQGVDSSQLAASLRLENSGATAVNKRTGAVGSFQIMPANVRAYGGDPFNFRSAATMAAKVHKDGMRRYPGNPRAQQAYYNGGGGAGDAVAAGLQAPSLEGRNYVSRFDAMRAGTPMPEGAVVPGAAPGGAPGGAHMTGTVEVNVNQDGKRVTTKTVKLTSGLPTAAGAQ